MRNIAILAALLALILGAALSLGAAYLAAIAVENRSVSAVRHALSAERITWAEVRADGLQITLAGTAPDEAMRFRAISATGSVIDASHVIDAIAVPPPQPLVPPKYAVELLRNAAGVTMIGLVPQGAHRERIAIAATVAAGAGDIADMLDTSAYPEAALWQPSLDLGLAALELLPRSKISVEAGQVAVTAVASSRTEKANIEAQLRANKPSDVALSLNISAPRPVIAPFTLRFVLEDGTGRFDACSAHTTLGRARILAAARTAGLKNGMSCVLGLGVPDPSWPDAAEAGLATVKLLGGGSLTMSDTDITLVAPAGTEPDLFDRITGELETALPAMFSLQTVLPLPESDAQRVAGPQEFTATYSPEGQVQLRGRVTDDLVRSATESFAHARFGRENVYAAMITDPELPKGWPMQVLVGLEALSILKSGSVAVNPGSIDISGVTNDPGGQAQVAQILTGKLTDVQDFNINISYVEPPKQAVETGPAPQECVKRVVATQDDEKIAFAPGSSNLQGGSLRIIDAIAEILRECPDVRLEIGGHTDSQGREEMNQQLSQQRAETILFALVSRRILTRNLTAVGFGETQPIADNDTEEGREANRRIEFRLITPEGAPTAAEPQEAAGITAPTQTEAENEQN